MNTRRYGHRIAISAKKCNKVVLFCASNLHFPSSHDSDSLVVVPRSLHSVCKQSIPFNPLLQYSRTLANMPRLTVFGCIAVFLGLATTVLAAATEDSMMARRSIRGETHAGHPKGYKPHRYHKPPMYHQPAPVSHNCPNTPYYIQASFNDNYAVLVAMPAVAPDAFAIYFNATEESTAVRFITFFTNTKLQVIVPGAVIALSV